MLCKINIIFKLSLLIIIIFFFTTPFSLQIKAEDDENKPDLDIISYEIVKEISSNNFTEGENVEFIVKIKNQGNKDILIGEIIKLGLYMDNSLIISNNSNKGLKTGKTCYINLSWIPSYNDIGTHKFELYVNYDLSIPEGDNYDNNVAELLNNNRVVERPTDLEITNIYYPGPFTIYKKSNIITKIRNNGKNSTGSIKAFLNSSYDGVVESVIVNDVINRDAYYNFSFNWTPTRFGNQKITFDIIYSGIIHPPKEINVDVGVDNLKWWNESYHYRQFISVSGSGNVSINLNFTELLENVGVYSQNFDNNIRIVEYSNTGDIIKIVQEYKFNESSISDPKGDLLWKVDNNANEHYYFVYFDVEINSGNRTYLQENNLMIKSGNAEANIGLIEGWSVNIINPVDGGYTLYNKTIDIIVETTAKAQGAEVYIFWNEDYNYNTNLYLLNDGNLTRWSYKNFMFDREGNWTIRVMSYDNAGYHAEIIQQEIFIGKPDLDVLEIKYSTNNIETLPDIHENDIINFSVIVYCYNVTLNNVKVKMSIFRKSNDEFIYSKYSIFLFLKNTNNTINFLWTVNTTGELYIHIEIDPNDIIKESDESNNNLVRSFNIIGWPDLEIIRINLPLKTIYEYDNVTFNIDIKNTGDWDAKNYTIKLCIYDKKDSDNKSDYERYRNNFNLKSNTEKTIPLYWNSAEPGKWDVYVVIIVEDTKKDINPSNNQKTVENLIVNSYERDPPIISNINYNPINQIQGNPLTISAKVVDDTGISFVEISITNPSGITSNYNMKKTGNDLYKFIFYKTSEYGRYSIVIYAEDISIHKNNNSFFSNYTINKDNIDPVVSFFNAEPYVQLVNKNVDIVCVADDNIGIEKVVITILTPNGQEIVNDMKFDKYGRYVYKNIYTTSGFYNASATVYDYGGNKITTKYTDFWITKNLDDTDDDGMPDAWEERYGFNPQDASDAKKDKDNDGYTNYEEYKINTHPTKDIFIQNMSAKIKDNVSYLAISIMLFIILIILNYIGKRRMAG